MAGNPNQNPNYFSTNEGMSQYVPEFFASDMPQPQRPTSSRADSRRSGGSGSGSSKWSEVEDKVLVSGMIAVGTDARIGTGQRKQNYWVRVLDYWKQSQREFPGLADRIPDQLRCRWNRISPKINKWVAATHEAERLVGSGMSDHDREAMGRSIYKRESNGNDFDLMHVWNILRHFDKWSVLPGMNPHVPPSRSSSHSSKRSREEEPEGAPAEDEDVYIPVSTTPTSAPLSPTLPDVPVEEEPYPPAFVAETPQVRPKGKKASKKARVGSSSGSDAYSQFTQSVHELTISNTEVAEIARRRLQLAELRLQSENERARIPIEVARIESERAEREAERARVEAERAEREAERAARLAENRLKYDMLQTLLAKTTLTPKEERAKNKLMNELFGLDD